tara:strand:- start:8610 stop:9806 length:1197 start_codon:yes stop_codon:yes gene_type:complete
MEKIKKKILFISPYFYPENIPFNKIIENLSYKEFEVTVLTSLPNYKIFKFFKGYSFLGPYNENIYKHKVIRVPVIPRLSNSAFSILIFYTTYFISSFVFICIWGLFNRNKYDHVTSYCGSPVFVGYLGILFSKVANCKNSIWIQDIWPEAILTSLKFTKSNYIFRIINYLQDKMWLKSQIILTESNLLTNYLNNNYNLSNVITLHNPIKEEIFNGYMPIVYNEQNKIVITYTGNVGKTQNLDRVLKLIDNNDDFIFNICGKGNDFNRLKLKYKNNKSIIFHGWLDINELIKIFKNTNFFFLTLNQFERQRFVIPSKFQTYLNYEKPIIFLGTQELCDYINKNNIGIGIDINTSDVEFTKMIKNLFNDKNYTLQINTIKEFKKFFYPNFLAKKYIDAIF